MHTTHVSYFNLKFRAEKAKLTENVAELEKKVATLEATLESNKEDISKKEGLINEVI